MSKGKDWTSRLRDLLDEVEPLGTFATTGSLKPSTLPSIIVEGVVEQLLRAFEGSSYEGSIREGSRYNHR
jgi:hypothetical protein